MKVMESAEDISFCALRGLRDFSGYLCAAPQRHFRSPPCLDTRRLRRNLRRNMLHEDFVLNRDCRGTLVPAGDDVILEKGTTVTVTQALGGTVTVRTDMGLFRISGKDLDAIGNGLRLQPKFDANEDAPFSEERVWEALKGCFDPEIPINIVDLGLIYDLKTEPVEGGKHRVFIKMTLTAPGCGMGPVIANDAKLKVEEIPGVEAAEVTIVWEPQWTPHMITPDGRVQLGLD